LQQNVKRKNKGLKICYQCAAIENFQQNSRLLGIKTKKTEHATCLNLCNRNFGWLIKISSASSIFLLALKKKQFTLAQKKIPNGLFFLEYKIMWIIFPNLHQEIASFCIRRKEQTILEFWDLVKSF
jgi:hypothetical protein